MSAAAPARTAARLTPAGAAVSLVALALFVYVIQRAGVADILDGFQRIGAGFIVILIFSGIRLAARALAWMRCVEGARLRFRDAFAATIAGDALGNLTPLGLIISEPAKAMYVRHRVPLLPAFSALAVENVFYSLSVAVVIACGMTAALFAFPMPPGLRLASVLSLAGVIAVLSAAGAIMLWQPGVVSGPLDRLQRLGVWRRAIAPRLERVREAEAQMYRLYASDRVRLGQVLAFEALFHVFGIAEVYLMLALIAGDAPTLLAAFVLESVNRVINVIFKFVPLRLGVDEAGTALFTEVLRYGTTAGVTMAVVRKARILFWSAIGLAALVRRGLNVSDLSNVQER